MTQFRGCDLLVIGAGPAGSATALRAARAGYSVCLVDRAGFPRDKPCAEYMSPETLRQFDLLGVLDRVQGLGGHPLSGLSVHGPAGASFTGMFARAAYPPFRPHGLSIPRQALDGVLVDAARSAGVTVLEGMTATDLLFDARQVAGAVVRPRHGPARVIRARLVAGADGLRSMVARRLGGLRPRTLRRIALVAHVRGVEGLGPHAEMHVGDRRMGYVGLNPLGNDLANVAVVLPGGAARPARGRPTAFFFDALDRFPGVRGRVSDRGLVRDVLVTGPFDARARRVTADGAILVGDAADFFDPFTGDGIHAALHGAALAAETLEEALALPGPVTARRLAGYRRARRAAFGAKWALERTIGYAMLAPSLFDRAVGRIERMGWSHNMVGVTGDWVPARELLRPRFLLGALR